MRSIFVQTDSTAQGAHMSCLYGDIAIKQFDKKSIRIQSSSYWLDKVLKYFLVWPHSAEDLNLFFNDMNNIDRTTKIQFIII